VARYQAPLTFSTGCYLVRSETAVVLVAAYYIEKIISLWNNQYMRLLKELTIVTFLSKYLAMILFILLPILGFYLGIKYQQALSTLPSNQVFITPSISISPTPPLTEEQRSYIITNNPIHTGWKTYTNPYAGISFSYPGTWRTILFPPDTFVDSDTQISGHGLIQLASSGEEGTMIHITYWNNPKQLSVKYSDPDCQDTKIVVAKV